MGRKETTRTFDSQKVLCNIRVTVRVVHSGGDRIEVSSGETIMLVPDMARAVVFDKQKGDML